MKQKASTYLIFIYLLSFILSGICFYLGTQDATISDKTYYVWYFVFSLLIALWVKNSPSAQIEGLDGPAYVFIFWPFILPFTLWKARGPEGLALYLGFLALCYFPTEASLYGYWYFVE